MTDQMPLAETYLTLLDWRRAVFDAYRTIRRQDSDPEAAWLSWGQTRSDLFKHHPQSPIGATKRISYQGPPLFEYDPRFRFAVSLTAPVDEQPFNVPAGSDGTVSLKPFATTDGLAESLGGELTLYWMQLYGGGVFLPFQDATSGRDTYGGGRYLLDTIKGADLGSDDAGRTILDFNFAYNPSCAYSNSFVCPLAPSSNRLPTSIEAGELKP